MPRQPNILDVVQAVTEVAKRYPQITAWWYAPSLEAPIAGGRPEGRQLEVVVEVAAGNPPDLNAVADDLSRSLFGNRVAVRTHRGSLEGKQLFRMLTNR